jgi:hypothetical protein
MSHAWTNFTPTGRLSNGCTTFEVQVRHGESGGDKETYFRHPSFGIVSVHQWHGATKGRLFQSNVDCATGISITINRCELKRGLSNDWIHPTDELVEIRLSPAQWAEMLVNMNTIGVPCTISHYRDDTGKLTAPVYPENFDNELARIEKEFKAAIDELEIMEPENLQVFKEIAARLPKKEQEKLFGALGRITSKVKSHIPFIRDMFEESIDRTVTQAKSEVANFTSQVLHQAGMDHLKDQAPTLKDLTTIKGELS